MKTAKINNWRSGGRMAHSIIATEKHCFGAVKAADILDGRRQTEMLKRRLSRFVERTETEDGHNIEDAILSEFMASLKADLHLCNLCRDRKACELLSLEKMCATGGIDFDVCDMFDLDDYRVRSICGTHRRLAGKLITEYGVTPEHIERIVNMSEREAWDKIAFFGLSGASE